MNDANREFLEILKICLHLDLEVFNIYKKFERNSTSPELRSFWKKIAEVKKQRVLFWEKALPLAEEDRLPGVFEDSKEIKDKLEKLKLKIDELLGNLNDISNNYEILAIAYKLEFFMIDPPVSTMFHLVRTIRGIRDVDDGCEASMMAFVTGLIKHGGKVPQAVEFMGENFHNLLHENKRLAIESNTDVLTGIYNRRGFFNAVNPILHLMFRKKINIAIMIADIDDFKDINFTYGHLGGDEALKYVASVIQASVRKSDVIGRYGGEEFIIYADCSYLSSESVLAERIRRNVEVKTEEALGFRITVSLGVASGQVGQAVENDIMALVKKADDNLFRAKSAGKNRFVC
jgi:diguanylate cyclase (GGDEF)-like protein